MKKVILLAMMCLMALTINAQKRCAVLDFQIGTGVTEDDIDGISYNFRSNFRPTGYTMLERMQINRAIKDLEFDRTDMTLQQMLRVGRNLDASVIVVGTMSKFMDEYSVDIRVINVSTGTTAATEGATFERTDYRNKMEDLAQKLSSQLTPSQGETPRPTTPDVQGYVNLGLPSGTLWKAVNESDIYTYGVAVFKFGGKLPTREQWVELKDYCNWTWTGRGYKITGLNDNFIYLPTTNWRECNTTSLTYAEANYGDYWSSTPIDSDKKCYFHFSSSSANIGNSSHCRGFAIRLVQQK